MTGDARVERSAARTREFAEGRDPRAVLDGEAATAAADLLASAGDDPASADPVALHTAAAFYWSRSLAHQDRALPAREPGRAIGAFGLLFMVDHRRVPRELWPRLRVPVPQTRVQGRVSLGDPVVHPLTAAEAAEGGIQWLGFLTAEAARSDYFLLSLTCAFRPPGNGDPFADAAVGVRLEPPAARRLADHPQEARRTTRVALTARLAFVEAPWEHTAGAP